MNESILVPGIPIVGAIPQAVQTDVAAAVSADVQGFQEVLQAVGMENGQGIKTVGKQQILDTVLTLTSQKTAASGSTEIPIALPSDEKNEKDGEIGLLAMAVAMATPPVIFQPVTAVLTDQSGQSTVGSNEVRGNALSSIASGTPVLSSDPVPNGLSEKNQTIPTDVEGSFISDKTVSSHSIAVEDQGQEQTPQTVTNAGSSPVDQSPLPVEKKILPQTEAVPTLINGLAATPDRTDDAVKVKANTSISQGENSSTAPKVDVNVSLSKVATTSGSTSTLNDLLAPKVDVNVSLSKVVATAGAQGSITGGQNKVDQTQPTVIALNVDLPSKEPYITRASDVVSDQPHMNEVWNDLQPVLQRDSKPIDQMVAKPVEKETPIVTETIGKSWVDSTESTRNVQGKNAASNVAITAQSSVVNGVAPVKDPGSQPQQVDVTTEISFSTRSQERPIINTPTAPEKLTKTMVAPNETRFDTTVDNVPVQKRPSEKLSTGDKSSSGLTLESKGQTVAEKANIPSGGVNQERLESKPIDPAMLTARQQGHIRSVQDPKAGNTVKAVESKISAKLQSTIPNDLKSVAGPVMEKTEQYASIASTQPDNEMDPAKVKDAEAVLGVKSNRFQQDFSVKDANPSAPAAVSTTTLGDSHLSAPAAKTVAYEPREVVNQIVHGTHVMVRDGAIQMQIRLDPPELGRVELKIVAEQDGIKAHFVAESQTVKALIETQLPHLRNALQQAGIHTDTLSVSVGGQGGQGANNGSAFNAFNGNGRENHSYYAQNQRYGENVEDDLQFHESGATSSPWIGRINLKA